MADPTAELMYAIIVAFAQCERSDAADFEITMRPAAEGCVAVQLQAVGDVVLPVQPNDGVSVWCEGATLHEALTSLAALVGERFQAGVNALTALRALTATGPAAQPDLHPARMWIATARGDFPLHGGGIIVSGDTAEAAKDYAQIALGRPADVWPAVLASHGEEAGR